MNIHNFRHVSAGQQDVLQSHCYLQVPRQTDEEFVVVGASLRCWCHWTSLADVVVDEQSQGYIGCVCLLQRAVAGSVANLLLCIEELRASVVCYHIEPLLPVVAALAIAKLCSPSPSASFIRPPR